MIARLQLSDLHLGDPRSTLSNLEVADRVTDALAELSGGEVGKLVLAGDVHEECVPADLDRLEEGVAASVARASEGFFGSLFRKVQVGEVVWVPGNHDLSAWDWYCRRPETRGTTITPYDGVTVSRSDWPWRVLYPGSQTPGMPCDLTVAYPLYRDRAPGDDFPLLLTTHGHLLDPLVLGRDSDATYLALRALGAERPAVPSESERVGSIRNLARLTLGFTLALWARYSARDYAYANYVMRRLEHPSSCRLQLDVPGDGYYLVDPVRDAPPPGEGYAANLPWFLEVALLDPELPSPVGELGRGSEAHDFAKKKSCLTFGHDHLGIQKTVVACGVPFECVDSGGWTSEHDGHLPHAHALVWRDRAQVVPETYFVRARTKSGGVL